MKYYEGRTVLVTGAANGIGLAIAKMAAEYGAKVVLGDIALEALNMATEEVRKTNKDVLSSYCDIRNMTSIMDMVAMTKGNFGVPDAVFANAGILGGLGAPWECSDDDFARIIDINLIGTWRTIKAVLPDMLARGSGGIVATSSVAGLVGAAGLAPYVASKHGVVGLVRSIALSVAKAGVRVNTLCPHLIETPMVDQLGASDPSFRQALTSQIPIGRMGEAREAAAAALWLASDQASFIVGHPLAVDGGYVAQ